MPMGMLAIEREIEMDLRKKKIVVVSIGVVIALPVILAFTIGGDKGPDLSGKKPEEIREYLRSEEFQGMERQERQQIARKAFEPMREQIEQEMFDRAVEYSKLPSRQKIKYLDKAIGEMQQRFKEREVQRGQRQAGEGGGSREGSGATRSDGARDGTGRPDGRRGDGGGRGSGGGGGGPSPERMRGRMERMEPKQRAYMTQFMEDMHKRMDERGIEISFGGMGGMGGMQKR